MIKAVTLDEVVDTAKAHALPAEEIEASRREWMVSELMRDDPTLTRDQALALIAEAEREAVA